MKGAVQDLLWDPPVQLNSVAVCGLLSDSIEKDACYQTVFSRAADTGSRASAFCDRVETTFRDACFNAFRK